MTNKTSIIMSVWNDENHVGRAIESILSQTEKNFVLLIVNDGSTDSTSKVVKSYRDPRIKFIDSPENYGLTKRLNELLEMVNTKYIARMDADDVSSPNRLAEQLKFMEDHPDAVAVGSNFVRIRSGRQVYKSNFPLNSDEIRSSILIKNPFKHSALFFRTNSLKEIGGYNNYFKYAQDYELMLRMVGKYPVYNLKDDLVTDYFLEKAISQQHRIEQGWYMLLAQILALLKYGYPAWQSAYLIRSLAFLIKSAITSV